MELEEIGDEFDPSSVSKIPCHLHFGTQNWPKLATGQPQIPQSTGLEGASQIEGEGHAGQGGQHLSQPKS